MIWFDLFLRHIDDCWLFNAKSFLNIYTENIRFGFVGFMAYQPLLVI